MHGEFSDEGYHPLDLVVEQKKRISSLEAENRRLREALLSLERACENVAATRSQEAYDAMINGGQSQALIALDRARLDARAALG